MHRLASRLPHVPMRDSPDKQVVIIFSKDVANRFVLDVGHSAQVPVRCQRAGLVRRQHAIVIKEYCFYHARSLVAKVLRAMHARSARIFAQA